MEISNINTILFDWDGTLCDSAGRSLTAFRRMFQDLGIEFNQQIYEAVYAPNWYPMYEALGVPKQHWDRADSLWRQHYGEGPVQLVPGGRETLSALSAKRFRLGVVSGGTHSRIVREIETLAIDSLFKVVICNEQVTNKKPHPEGLEMALRLLDCEPRHCAFVGDTPEDVEMGSKAEVLTVGVASGYPTCRNIVKPDIWLESISGLLEYF